MQRTNGSCLVTTTSTVFKGEKVESIVFENGSNRSPFSASEQLDIFIDIVVLSLGKALRTICPLIATGCSIIMKKKRAVLQLIHLQHVRL